MARSTRLLVLIGIVAEAAAAQVGAAPVQTNATTVQAGAATVQARTPTVQTTATAVQAGVSTRSQKTLRRFHDPVVLSTGLLKGLTERRTSRLRLYSLRAGLLQAIPYQFDQRDDDGELIFPAEGSSQAFSFDENDELIFMAKDSGDRANPAMLYAKGIEALEIEVTDPATGERGWAYLVQSAGDPPPRSPVIYATFNTAANRARGLFYTMQYSAGRNFFTGMSIARAAGGTGQDLLNRMRVQINPAFSLLLIRWSPSYTEEDFSVTIDGVKNGPVRAIRRVRQRLDLGKFLPNGPTGTVYTYYYFSSFTTPSKFSLPWLALKAMREFRFLGVDDFNDSVHGMTYRDPANPEGLRFTGHNQLHVNASEDHEWWVLSGEAGALMHVLIIPEQWKRWGIVRGTVFLDATTTVGRQQHEQKQAVHMAGFRLLNMTNIRRSGSYDLNLATIFLPGPYHPGDEAGALAMLRQPLSATVRLLAR